MSTLSMRPDRLSPTKGAPTLLALLLLTGGLTLLPAQTVYTVDDDDGFAYAFASGDTGPYLGVRLVEETELAEGGARVSHVVPDSPADEAGIRKGDVVVEFDGEIIRGPVSLTRRIHAHKAGETVKIRIVRDGKKQTLEA